MMRSARLAAGLAALSLAITGCGEDTGSTGRVTDTDNVMGAKYKVGDSVDLNNDGTPDGVAVDSNGDGIADSVDTNGDGKGDQPLPGASAGGGANGGSGNPGGTNGGAPTPGNNSGTNASAGGNGDEDDAGMSSGGPSDNGGEGSAGAVDDPDTLGDDRPGAIACGDGPSCAAGQKCCAARFAVGNTECKASCGGDIEAVCDGPEDCPNGQFCCSGIMKSYCGTSCGGDFTGCHTAEDDCQPNQECRANSVYKMWGICD